MIEGLVEQFATLTDPRCPGKIEHRLVDILVELTLFVVHDLCKFSGWWS